MGSVPAVQPLNGVYDILIVGAGLGGINCAYRFQSEMDGCRYAIVETRNGVGAYGEAAVESG